MSNEVRSAVADFLGPKLNAATGRLAITFPMHPSLLSAYQEHCQPFFLAQMLPSKPEGFGLLDDEAGQAKLLDMLEDEKVKEEMLREWGRRHQSGLERWKSLENYAKKKNPRLVARLVEVQFSYTYPRLDVNVSKGMNHLLKSPWCVHPKTGRVCVPVDPEAAYDFDPSTTPTLRTIAADLDAAGVAEKGTKDISRTQLVQYEAAFDAFLKTLENGIRGAKARASKASSMEF